MSVVKAIGNWIRQRLKGLRYMLADLVGLIKRGWKRLSIKARRGIAIALAAIAVIVLFFVLAVPNLPCAFPGGDRCAPPDDAAELVPADSLAYLHVNLDPENEQTEQLAASAERIPLFAEQLVARALALAPGPGGIAPVYERDIKPWFAGEAAVAVVPGPNTSAEQVLLFEVDDSDAATGFADSIASGVPEVEDYEGVELSVDGRGLTSAQTEGFLIIGSASGVRSLIDVATGAEGAGSLADDSTAEGVRDELPEHFFLDAWISESGAAELLTEDGPTSALASFSPFISPGSTAGAAIALSAGEDSFGLAVRSELDSEREESAPGFFAAFPEFEPDLAERLSADAIAYLGFGEPGKTLKALLGQAAAQAPGVAAGFEDLVADLRKQGDVDLEQELLPALGDEAAIAIETAPEGAPFLEFVASGVNEAQARAALARLQRPLADTANPGSDLQAPVFGESEVDGVSVKSLRVSPSLELSYAVFDELAAIANNPAGIERLISEKGGLDESGAYEEATDGLDEDGLVLLAFFDLRKLIAQGFQIGLAQVPAFNTFADDFRSLAGLGLAVRREDNLLATDARVRLGDPADGLVSPPND